MNLPNVDLTRTKKQMFDSPSVCLTVGTGLIGPWCIWSQNSRSEMESTPVILRLLN